MDKLDAARMLLYLAKKFLDPKYHNEFVLKEQQIFKKQDNRTIERILDIFYLLQDGGGITLEELNEM